MTIYTGKCPKCNAEKIALQNFEWYIDFIVTQVSCSKCGYEFKVMFSGGKLAE